MAAVRPSRRYHIARRLTQVGLLLFWCALPWFDVVRIEVGTQQVVYFGVGYPIQFPYILGLIVPFVITVWILALLSYLKGRVFCGWACPYGSTIELFEGLRTAVWRGTNRKVAAWIRRGAIHKWALRLGAVLTLIFAPVALAFCLAGYLVPPRQLVQEVLFTRWGTGGATQLAVLSWVALMLVISWVAGFFVRFHFCRMVCIYGMGQAMAASTAEAKKILRPRFLPESLDACGNCQACLKACFLDLDPRDKYLVVGFSSGCFNCGECIDSCTTIQAHKGGPSLLSFKSGGTP